MKAVFRWAWVLLLAAAAQAQTAPKVVEIEIQGQLKRVSESLIKSTLGLAPGVELSQENVQEAMRALLGLNVFADIQLFADRVPTGVKLIVKVEEYPALEEVRFKGNKHLKEKEMKDALGLVAGQVLAPRDIARGRQKIVDLYKGKGFLRAEVVGKPFEAEEEGKVFLQYDIKEGEKVRIARVSILDNQAVSNAKLKKQMETKEKRWWRRSEFKADTYEADKEKILTYLRSKGYAQSSIARDSVYYDESKKNLFIDVAVDEGSQYRLGQVRWEGNALFDTTALRWKIKLQEGDVYKMSSQELAYLVKSAYYEKGYLDTEVMPQEQPRGDTMDVSFRIFEGQPFRIRQIKIAGNTKTREKVLRREIELRPGDTYQQSLVQESQRRLFMLNFFKDVQVMPEYSETEAERAVDLTFQVEEKPTGTASMGAGYSGRDKLVGTIGLQIPNLRGAGQSLDFNWEFGTRREMFLVGFTEPWVLDTPTSFYARVYTLNQEYYSSFDHLSNSASVRIGRRLQKPSYTTASLGYRLQSEKYRNFSADFDSTLITSGRYDRTTTSSFELQVQRDTRDMPMFPSKGTLISYRPQVAASFVGGDVNFHSHEILANFYRPSWWKFILSVETKLAAIEGFSAKDNTQLPFFERFTPGGVDWWDGQVRGYPDASLGPRESGVNVGGRAMTIINLEYRFPLAQQQFYGLLFLDAGNSWDWISSVDPRDLRRSAGFGFRVVTPMLGVIGFDFGYGFDRRKVDGFPPGWTTHFQFGPRFF
jgi:outer membrane protein insertion porin family